MRPDNADRAYLLDMLRYARHAVDAVRERTLANYLADENLRLATERRIEIIGEAARHLSVAFTAAHMDIPWRKITAQRHVLAHDYGEIDPELVWRVVTVHLPILISQLEELLGNE